MIRERSMGYRIWSEREVWDTGYDQREKYGTQDLIRERSMGYRIWSEREVWGTCIYIYVQIIKTWCTAVIFSKSDLQCVIL